MTIYSTIDKVRPCLQYVDTKGGADGLYGAVTWSLMLQLSGFVIAGAGLWIKLDKIEEIRLLMQEVVDPAILVIIAGCVLFTFGFLGCVGALRENLTLLRWVSMSLEKKHKICIHDG